MIRKRWNKRIKMLMRPFWIIFLLAICLFSCKGPDREEATGSDAHNENILRFDVAAAITILDPSEVRAYGSSVIYPLLFSYLCVPDENGELQPDLAREWHYDQETFSWTITLRADAVFHNRQPVTSADIIYSVETVLQNVCPTLFELIASIILVSDTVIQLRLDTDDPVFLKKIWDMEIICSSVKADIDYYHFPVGSGPFRFQSRDEGDRVILAANPDYYQGRPSLDGVVFYYQPDKEKSWARLLAGETDIAQEISPKNYEMIKTYEDMFYFDHYTLEYYTILLYNTRDPLFSETNVRLALTHAIDRQFIVDQILKGYGTVAVSPMGEDSPFHNPELKPIPYDPEEAVRLLKTVGWQYDEKGRRLLRNGRMFEFTVLVPKGAQIEKIVSRFIQLCLSDIGVSVRVRTAPLDEMQELYHRHDTFQAVLTELAGVYTRPEYFLDLWTPEPDMRSEAGGFSHPELTRILRMAVITENPAMKKEYLYQAEALIVSLQPGTFLFHKTALDVMSKRFFLTSPFSLFHEGIYRLRYATLDQKRVSSR